MKGMDLGGFLFLLVPLEQVRFLLYGSKVMFVSQFVHGDDHSFIHSVYLSVCHSFIDVEEQMGVICVLHNVQSICR